MKVSCVLMSSRRRGPVAFGAARPSRSTGGHHPGLGGLLAPVLLCSSLAACGLMGKSHHEASHEQTPVQHVKCSSKDGKASCQCVHKCVHTDTDCHCEDKK